MRCLIAITQLSLSLTASYDANYAVSPCLVAAGPSIGLQGVLCDFPSIWPIGDPPKMWKEVLYQDFQSPAPA